MSLRKSLLSAAAMGIGAAVLLIMAVLYCFSEIQVPGYVYIFGWVGSILAIVDIVGKIERQENGQNMK